VDSLLSSQVIDCPQIFCMGAGFFKKIVSAPRDPGN
jgi:hypothetical protein